MRGPIAPENNPPINPQFFQPSLFDIAAITNAPNALVTTTVNHNYVVGQTVRFIVSQIYGMFQINEQQADVVSIPASNQFVVDLNTLKYNAFVPNTNSGFTQPQVAAIGDLNSGPTNTGRSVNQTFVQGSFINISPL